MIASRGSARPARANGGRFALVAAGMVTAALGGCDRDVPLAEWRDAGGPDAPFYITEYKGTLMRTPPKAFGGSPYCNYTITLERIEIDLDIPLSGLVTKGRVQHLNVETTDADCPHGVIPSTMASYTLRSAFASGADGMQLTFQGDSSNYPVTSLVVDLLRSGTVYSAVLSFHRIDHDPPLDWSVDATLPLYRSPGAVDETSRRRAPITDHVTRAM